MAAKEWLAIGEYGETDRPSADCVIIDIHGGNPTDFLETFPEVITAAECDETTLRNYLDLEKDTGSTEVAHEVAQQIIDLQEGTRVVVISVLFPRGIIEPQRLSSETAVKAVFRTNEHQELTQYFQEIHRATQQKLKKLLQELLEGKNGTLIDMHTMASHNPMPQIAVAPENIPAYIQSFTDGPQKGMKRKLDIVTGRGPKFPRFSSETLTKSMKAHLAAAGFEHAENEPYFTLEGMLSDEILQQYHGIALDIPKNYLTESQPGNPHYSSIRPEINPEKVRRIATPIAKGVISKSNIF